MSMVKRTHVPDSNGAVATTRCDPVRSGTLQKKFGEAVRRYRIASSPIE